MNKLTTINTIKKAAPLALLAVVMSGSAFAGPGKGQGPKDKDPSAGAQASVNVFNLCDVVPVYDDYGAVVDYDLEVVTTITNTSGDTPVDALLSEISVQGKQKSRGKPTNLGPANIKIFDPAKAISDTYESTARIGICDELSDKYRDAGLGAEIEVTIDNSKFGTFSGRCDDDPSDNVYMTDDQGNLVLDSNGDPIVLEYGPDQSNVDYYGGMCP